MTNGGVEVTSQFTATQRLSEQEVKRSGWRTAVSAYSMVEKPHWLGGIGNVWLAGVLGPALAAGLGLGLALAMSWRCCASCPVDRSLSGSRWI